MLEAWAIAFASMSGLGMTVTIYATFIAGCLLGIFLGRRTRRIARGPYFGLIGLIALAATAVQTVWWLFLSAVLASLLWLVVAAVLGSMALAGYLVGGLAAARSIDAFGHRNLAPLTFIPFANLWLLFVPTQDPPPPHRPLSYPPLAGGVGVAVGIVAVAASWALSAYVPVRAMEIAGRDNAQLVRSGIVMRVRTEGLENVLTDVASAVKTPIVIDEITTLSRVDASGSEFRRIFLIDSEDLTIDDAMKAAVVADVCRVPVLAEFARNGATIRQVYTTPSGRTLADLIINDASCGA